MTHLKITELEAELKRRGVRFSRTWERSDPEAPYHVRNYVWVFRVSGIAVARGASSAELETAVNAWWEGYSV